MRVVYVIDSLEQGGAERSLVELLPEFAKHDVEVTVAVLRAGGVFREAAEDAGAQVVHVGGRGRAGQFRSLADLVARRRPDLVHTTLYEANILGRLVAEARRVPVVSSLVNTPYGPDQLAGPVTQTAKVRAVQALDIATARLVARFHANATHVADVMASRLHVPRDRFDVIPRGRNPATLGRRTPERRAAVRASLGLEDSTPVVLTVARHERQKNLETAIEVLRRGREARPDAVLLVAGREGNETERLRSLIGELGVGDAVRLLGHRDDVPDLLAAADVFLFPSRREGFPGVVIEAMALEIPLVASDLPGTRDALGVEPGTLPGPDDVDELTMRVLHALSDTRADETTARRLRFENHFTVDATASAMHTFYERTLAG